MKLAFSSAVFCRYKFHLLISSFLLLAAVFSGCASHPTVAPRTLEKGETFYGYSLSIENVFPVLYYRYGITDRSDIGLRVGLPIYGSGVDYSRILYEKENKRDVLNVAWSLSPNSNFDFTYYKFTQNKKRKGVTTFWGMRGMFIPNGISGGQSVRLGFLIGSYMKNIGYEIGYFHDFSSMPITKLFSTNFDYADTSQWGTRYLNYPHSAEGGLPTEYSRITGLSIRFSFILKDDKVKPESN
tara:strand:+ start:17539 stop:18261 length:723 start_codon:yes stop_codon:yes gene_type:complete